jgi:hypothetical protein
MVKKPRFLKRGDTEAAGWTKWPPGIEEPFASGQAYAHILRHFSLSHAFYRLLDFFGVRIVTRYTAEA